MIDIHQGPCHDRSRPLTAAAASAAAAALLAAPALAGDLQLQPQAAAFARAADAGTPLYTLSHDEARNVLATVQQDRLPTAPVTIEDTVWNVGPTGAVRSASSVPKAHEAACQSSSMPTAAAGSWATVTPTTT